VPRDPLEIVRSFQEAFALRDAERFASFLHPHVEWSSAENFLYADHSPYRGIEAVMGLIFGRLLDDWDGFSITADEILGGDDLVIASGRFRGTFKANGAFVNAQLVQVFQLEGDRIAKCQVYTDTAQFKEAVSRIHLNRVGEV